MPAGTSTSPIRTVRALRNNRPLRIPGTIGWLSTRPHSIPPRNPPVCAAMSICDALSPTTVFRIRKLAMLFSIADRTSGGTVSRLSRANPSRVPAAPKTAPEAPAEIPSGCHARLASPPATPERRYAMANPTEPTKRSAGRPSPHKTSMFMPRCTTPKCRNMQDSKRHHCPFMVRGPKLAPQSSKVEPSG